MLNVAGHLRLKGCFINQVGVPYKQMANGTEGMELKVTPKDRVLEPSADKTVFLKNYLRRDTSE